jgi:hypothetical protein
MSWAKMSVDRVFEGERVTELEFKEFTLMTTVVLKTKSGKQAQYLITDAPEWVRECYQSYKLNEKTAENIGN